MEKGIFHAGEGGQNCKLCSVKGRLPSHVEVVCVDFLSLIIIMMKQVWWDNRFNSNILILMGVDTFGVK